MPQPLSPAEVFHALVRGVCDRKWDDLPGLHAEQTNVVHPLDPFRAPPLLTREQLHEHFAGGDEVLGDVRFEPANITIHETADPEVIIAEFEYQGTGPATREPFALSMAQPPPSIGVDVHIDAMAGLATSGGGTSGRARRPQRRQMSLRGGDRRS